MNNLKIIPIILITFIFLSIISGVVSATTEQEVLHLKLNNNLTDDTGNYTITDNGTSNGTGILSGARDFDADTDYLQLSDDFTAYNNNNKWSFSFWLNWRDTISSTNPRIIEMGYGGFLIDIDKSNSHGISVYNEGSSSYQTTEDTMPTTDTWIHYIVTVDGQTIKIYHNNTEVSYSNTNGISTSWNGSGSGRMIGHNQDSAHNTDTFDGLIDDFRVYNYVLTENERDALYNSGNGNQNEDTSILETMQYRLNETSGTDTGDSSGNDFNGTRTGGTIISNGKINYAVDLGASDYIDVPYQAGTGLHDFSMTFWGKIDVLHTSGTTNPTNNIISIAKSGNANMFFLTYEKASGKWKIAINNTNYDFDGDTTVEDLDWHYITYVREGSTSRLYIDGSKVGNDISTSDYVLDPDNGGFILGQDQDNVGGGFDDYQSWDGKLDDFRIYNFALNSAQISYLYNSGDGTENLLSVGSLISPTSNPLYTYKDYNWNLIYRDNNYSTPSKDYDYYIEDNDTNKYIWTKLNIDSDSTKTFYVYKYGGYSPDKTAVFGTDLQGFYTLNNTTNDVLDNNPKGVIYGATLTTDREGNINSAYYFDGSSYIDLGNNSSLQPSTNYSISLWVKSNELVGSGHNPAFYIFANNDNRIYLDYPNGSTAKIYSVVDGSASWSDTIVNPIDLNWHNITITMNGTTWKNYYDGNLISTYTMQDLANFTGTANVYLGGYSGYYMYGKVDDFRIYNKTLTSDEVGQLAKFYKPSIDVTDKGDNIYKIDVTNNYNNNFLDAGHIDDGGNALCVYSDGTYIYLANDSDGLRAYTFDGSTFTNVGHINEGHSKWVYTDGTYIYVADDSSGLKAYTFDGSTFTNVGNIDDGGAAEGIWGDGTYIYLANYTDGLRAYTFDGSTFTNVGHIDNGGYAFKVWGDGTYIYLANYTDGLRAYTFDGSTFTNVGHVSDSTYTFGVWGDGNYIYAADWDAGLKAYTFNGSSFTNVGNIDDGGNASDVWCDGTYVYLANDTDGLRAYAFDGNTFSLIDNINSGGNARRSWNDGDYTYLANFSDGLRAYTFSGDLTNYNIRIPTDIIGIDSTTDSILLSDQYIDQNYIYSFGFDNDTNYNNGVASTILTNQTLNVSDANYNTYPINYKPIQSDINNNIYSWVKIDKYINGVLDSYQRIYTTDDKNIISNFSVNLQHPQYPDDYNKLYPTRIFDWNNIITDYAYDTNKTYKYDFGFNDTNSLNGNETQVISSSDLNVNSINPEDHYIGTSIPSSWVDSNIYAYINLYYYDNGSLLSTNTFWTDNTASVGWSRLRLKTYDEKDLNKLDEHAKLYDTTNSTTYQADTNGIINVDINSDNSGYNSCNVSRELSGTITHPERQFDILLNKKYSIDENLYLLDDTNGSNIEYLVKNLDNMTWSNKYLMFRLSSSEYTSPIDDTLINNYITTGTTSEKRGVIIQPNKNVYLNSIDFNIDATHPATKFYVFDKNIDALIYEGDINSEETSVGLSYYTNLELRQDHIYSILLDNNGSDYTYYKSINYLSSDLNKTNIDYLSGTDGYNNPTTDAYNIISINTIDKNILDSMESEPIILLAKTDSDGKFTGYVLPDGNYFAYLYNDEGVLENIYKKVTVEVKKPLNEITLSEISPYDVRVGGLLTYSLTNQTASSVSFDVFGGTVDYYSVQVVDYNSVVKDRKYIPREYLFNIPYGSSYSTTYSIQPYLLLLDDGVTPTIYVYDKLKRAIYGVIVEIYKSVNGSTLLMQSSKTTSMGRMSFSAYPFDNYTIKLYYNNNLSGTYYIQPRSSSDDYYFVIDTIINEDQASFIDSSIDWGNTDDNINISTTNPTANIDVNVFSNTTTSPTLTAYSVKAYQNNSLIATNTGSLTGSSTNINSTFDKSLFDSSTPIITYVLDFNYSFGGVTYSKESTYSISIIESNNRIFTLLKSVPDEIGRIWAIILSLLIVISILAFITLTGFVTDTKAITIMGIFLIGFFLFLGWLNTGVTILGTDVIVFTYVISSIFGLFLMLKGGLR